MQGGEVAVGMSGVVEAVCAGEAVQSHCPRPVRHGQGSGERGPHSLRDRLGAVGGDVQTDGTGAGVDELCVLVEAFDHRLR